MAKAFFAELCRRQKRTVLLPSLKMLICGTQMRRQTIMKAYKAMLKTELKLSIRGMDMVIFALCMPVVIMIILGIIYGSKPAFEGASYTFLAQSFGAVSAVAIGAGGVMGLPLVISDYRNKKILKRFKVT